MSLVSAEWNQLIKELGVWHVFGRDLERTQ